MSSVPDSDGIAARQVAFGLLNDIFFKRRSFDEAMAASARLEELSARDRAFVRLLVATVLKRARQMDAVLQHFLHEPSGALKPANLINIFRLGMAQLVFLKTPEHAAVNTTVELTEAEGMGYQKPLVNAIMRRLTREGFPEMTDRDAGKFNTPEWLWTQWMKDYGVETALDIAAANLGEASLDITVKSDPAGWAEKLEAELLPTGSLRKHKPLSRSAGEGGDPRSGEGEGVSPQNHSYGDTPSLQLSPAERERGHKAIPDMPGFAEGEWWIQNAAAALPAKLFGDLTGKTVVDLCAAPGGKTAQLCAQGAKVIALDRSAQRITRLKENMTRLKCDVETVIADGAEWKPSALVDAVLLDAPCSATGTIRHQPDILHLKEMKDQEKLAALQRRLIVNAASMLKPGGILIYCTCSLQKAESEAQVDWVLSQKLPLKLSPITTEEVPAELLTDRGEIRCLPQHWQDIGGMDGFYVVRFVKQ